jgi:Tub family
MNNNDNNNQGPAIQEAGQPDHRPADAAVAAAPIHDPNAYVLPPPHPFQVAKDARYLNRATGRIQCRVSQERMANRKLPQRWVCYAEGIDGTFPTSPMFVMERQGRRGYRIMDVSQDDPLQLAATLASNPEYFGVDPQQDARYVGDVQYSQSRLGGFVEYKLVREKGERKDRTLEATTIMATSSLRYPVVNGYADRIVYSVIQDQNAKVRSNQPAVSSTSSSTAPAKTIHFDSLNQPVIEHIQDDIHKIGEDHEELKILQSKRRFTNYFGRKVHRDLEPYQQKFHGRALRASKKNLQIMEVASGKVMLQVGRLNKTDFSLDFLPPYTPFQALGLFLAQLDAN